MFLNPKKVISQIYIDPYSSVLDVGTGLGAYSLSLAKRDPTLEVFALDINRDLVKRLSKEAKELNIKNLKPIVGDAEVYQGMKIKKDLIDFVILSNVLFQTENKAAVVKEISRVLKPSGKIVLIDWKDSFNNMGPHTRHIVGELKAIDIFMNNNFKIVSKIDAGDYHYGIIFEYEK